MPDLPSSLPPSPLRTISVAELSSALIAVFEGCRLSAYRDSGGVLTIGYGHTGPDVKEGMAITQAQAEAWLEADQRQLFALVAGRSLLEAAALVSFGYNCGIGTLHHVLDGEAPLAVFVHDRAGHELPGLVARRRLEEALIRAGRSTSNG